MIRLNHRHTLGTDLPASRLRESARTSEGGRQAAISIYVRRWLDWLGEVLCRLLDAATASQAESVSHHPCDCRCAACCEMGFAARDSDTDGPIILRFGAPSVRLFDGPTCGDCRESVIDCRCSFGEG